jgi:hypothetical protein
MCVSAKIPQDKTEPMRLTLVDPERPNVFSLEGEGLSTGEFMIMKPLMLRTCMGDKGPMRQAR